MASRNAENSKIEINTDMNMILADNQGNILEALDFNDVSFNGKAYEEALNIQNITDEIIGSFTINNTFISTEENILKFTGDIDSTYSRRRLQAVIGQNSSSSSSSGITMYLKDINKNETKEYECSLIYPSSSSCEIACDTSRNPIATNVNALHLSIGLSSDDFLYLIEMREPDDYILIEVGNSPILPPFTEYQTTSDDEAETGNATSYDSPVPSSKPVSVKGYRVGDKHSSVQIMKFHSFSVPQEGEVKFSSFFFLLEEEFLILLHIG